MTLLQRHTKLMVTTLLAAGIAATVAADEPAAPSSEGPVYELRVYTCEPGKLAAPAEIGAPKNIE